MTRTVQRTYNGVQHKITILDVGEYVFWKVSQGRKLTTQIREQMRKDFHYLNYTALDFGIDEHGNGIWELKKDELANPKKPRQNEDDWCRVF